VSGEPTQRTATSAAFAVGSVDVKRNGRSCPRRTSAIWRDVSRRPRAVPIDRRPLVSRRPAIDRGRGSGSARSTTPRRRGRPGRLFGILIVASDVSTLVSERPTWSQA
jgi:hypothetical protein